VILLQCLKNLWEAFTAQPPCLSELFRIADTPYEANVYDCSEKAADFWKACQRAGYDDSRVTVYRTQRGRGTLHSVVWVTDNKGREWLCDPTSGRYCRKAPADWLMERKSVPVLELLGCDEWI